MTDDGRARYAAAAARGRRAVPSDPLRNPAVPSDPREAVAAMARPCTRTEPAPCGHPGYEHNLNDGGQRTSCSTATAAGKCPCRRYRTTAPPD